MKITAYKRLLSKYPSETLEQIHYVADALELRRKDKLAIEEKEIARIGLRALTVSSDRVEEIMDLMQYDWQIFEGQHHRLTPRDNSHLTPALINIDNLKNLIRASDALVEERNPQVIKFSFERKHILAYQSKKRGLAVGERGTYREGLLKALTDPRIGITKNVDVVLEIINDTKELPTLGTLAEKKAFFRRQISELQSSLKAARLGGILTLKWSKDNRYISLKTTS